MASKAIPKICSEEQPKIPTSQVVDPNACRAPSPLIPKASKSEPATPRNFPKTIQNSLKAATEVSEIRKVNHHRMGSADSIHDKVPTKIVQSPDLNLLHGGSESVKQSNQQGDSAEIPPVILEVIGNQEMKDSDPSLASAKVSDGISSLTKTSGSAKNSDLVESGKSSMCRASTSSDVSDESSCSSLSSRINKPHRANDSRSEAIQAVRAKDGMLGLSHFRLLRRLGCGDIGSVYLSELSGTKCYFAMKPNPTTNFMICAATSSLQFSPLSFINPRSSLLRSSPTSGDPSITGRRRWPILRARSRCSTASMASSTELIRSPYPHIEPYGSGFLKVSDLHTIYWEQSGNPSGHPVVFLHGGPGAGTSATNRRFFDPEFYRIILFDQRGAGKSTPHACLEENTTWDLVSDIEKLREHLDIPEWQVFGGSWGSTLALAYSQTHPEKVTGIVLRGIFLLRKKELDWFYEGGAAAIFPDAWEPFRDFIPEKERGNFIEAYCKRLNSSDINTQVMAAKIWTTWELMTAHLVPNEENIRKGEDDKFSLAFARIENHYFVNKGFLSSDSYLLDNIDKIRHIKTFIVQGRYDVCCPMMSAWDLHKAWPEAELKVVADAGHSASEPGITAELVAANETIKNILNGGRYSSR